MIPNVGLGEIGLILLVVLIVLGPERMPDIARALGKAYRTFQVESRKAQAMLKDGLADVEAVTKEIRSGLDEPMIEAQAVADDVRQVRASFDEPMQGVALPPPPPSPAEMAPPMQPNPPLAAPPPPGVIDLPDDVRQHEDT